MPLEFFNLWIATRAYDLTIKTYDFPPSYGFQLLCYGNPHEAYACMLSYGADGCGIRQRRLWARTVVVRICFMYRTLERSRTERAGLHPRQTLVRGLLNLL